MDKAIVKERAILRGVCQIVAWEANSEINGRQLEHG